MNYCLLKKKVADKKMLAGQLPIPPKKFIEVTSLLVTLKSNEPHHCFYLQKRRKDPGGDVLEIVPDHVFCILGEHPFTIERGLRKMAFMFICCNYKDLL